MKNRSYKNKKGDWDKQNASIRNCRIKYSAVRFLLLLLGKLHYLWDGGQNPAEWAKFFGRVFRSGQIFSEVCFVVGEKF